MENVRAHTDTGGIAGLSTGYIQDCINHGPIGYKYMGYNVGGIVGRQSGHLSNCQNYNIILGRKDVGGIVGQVEPHLILLFSEDTLQKLDKELDVLQSILNNSLDNSRSSVVNISLQFDDLMNYVSETKDITQILSGYTIDYVDNVNTTINITGERIRYTMEEIIPMLDDAEKLSITFNHGINHIESGFNNLEITSNEMAKALNKSKYALDDLRDAVNQGERAIYNIRQTLDMLSGSFGTYSEYDIYSSLQNNLELSYGLEELGESFFIASTSMENFADTLEDFEEDIENKDTKKNSEKENEDSKIDIDFGILEDNLYAVYDELKSVSSIFFRLSDSIHAIDDSNLIIKTFEDLQYSFVNLDSSIAGFSNAFSQFESASKNSSVAFREFKLGFNKFGDASKDMTTIIISTRNLLDSLVSMPNIVLPNVSSDYRQSGEELFANLNNISNQIGKINESTRDTKNDLINNMEALGNQIFTIFELLAKSREDRASADYIEDISSEDINNTSLGVLYKNQNYGFVHGSVNVGGITGAIGIEYDLDPEDDILKIGNPSLNFKYLTSSILKNCINHGPITGKKDYVGGIAGLMDLGIITECENYGDIKSKEGNYVGGIAGASYTTINKSFVLSSLWGKNYVGGLAGYGTNLTNSYTLIDIKNGSECIGAIAGQGEGEIMNNYFVHNKLAAIDGISFREKASPITYEELLMVKDLPKAFTQFHITFKADGKVIEKFPFIYGDSFDLKKLPDIPKVDGFQGSWENFNSDFLAFNTIVEAVYNPLRTVLSSDISRHEDVLPLFLVEGSFYNDSNLKVYPATIDKNKFPIKNNKVLESWEIALDGLEKEEKNYKVRLLLPNTKKKLTIWELKDNVWEEIESSINGSYVLFTMKGASGNFAVVENTFSWGFILIISCVFLLMIFIIRKFNKNKIN